MPEDEMEYLNGTWESAPTWDPDNRSLFRIVDLGVFLTPIDIGQNRIRVTRLRIEVQEDGFISVIPKSGNQWTQEYQLSPQFLTLGSGDRKWHCRRIEADEIPEWFEKGVAEALARPW